MKKGFINLILLGAIAIISIGVSVFFTQKLVNDKEKFGASVQTQLSDTIGTFRTNTNTNFTNLDNAVASVTSTIATYGTIVTQNSPLPVNAGGTATTTSPSANQFLSANGTLPAWKTLVGNTGITLTNGVTSTVIGTAGFDNTANISFTGNNTHSGTEGFSFSTSFSATSSFTGTTQLNGVTSFGSLPTIPTSVPTSTAQPISLGFLNTKFQATSSLTTTTPGNGVATTTISLTLPSASSTSFYSIGFFITGINNSTTTIGINGSTLCTMHNDGGNSNDYAGVISVHMLNSLTSELMVSGQNSQNTANCAINGKTSKDFSSSPVFTATTTQATGVSTVSNLVYTFIQ